MNNYNEAIYNIQNKFSNNFKRIADKLTKQELQLIASKYELNLRKNDNKLKLKKELINEIFLYISCL